SANEYAPLQRGDEAPAYGAVSLDGDSVALASLAGRPVLLNVWATWCPPCREEMPALQELHDRYDERGLAVVAVSLDASAAHAAPAAGPGRPCDTDLPDDRRPGDLPDRRRRADRASLDRRIRPAGRRRHRQRGGRARRGLITTVIGPAVRSR